MFGLKRHDFVHFLPQLILQLSALAPLPVQIHLQNEQEEPSCTVA